MRKKKEELSVVDYEAFACKYRHIWYSCPKHKTKKKMNLDICEGVSCQPWKYVWEEDGKLGCTFKTASQKRMEARHG
jgi:hypothetical protein